MLQSKLYIKGKPSAIELSPVTTFPFSDCTKIRGKYIYPFKKDEVCYVSKWALRLLKPGGKRNISL